MVFEVLSPGNRPAAMGQKFQFYDTYGVEEYYIYDPDEVVLTGWRRVGDRLQPIPVLHNWVSPRLGIRFDLSGPELVIYDRTGQRFLTFVEIHGQWQEIRQRTEQAERRAQEEQRQRQQAEQRSREEQQQREQAERRAHEEQQQRLQAEQQARAEQQQREQAEQRAALAEHQTHLLRERLRAAGIDPDAPPQTPSSS